MSRFAPAIAVADLPPGQGAEVTVGGEVVAIFNVNGTFHALAGRCPHRGGPLGQGFVDGAQVSCPWHNWTFDVATGENVASARAQGGALRGQGGRRKGLGASRMRNMTRSHFAPIVLLLAAAAALRAQETPKPVAPPAAAAPAAAQEAPPPTFPAQVEQVIVDVVVTDKKGNVIRGLKQQDLTILEDGAPQTVVSFEAVQLPDQPSETPPPPPRVSINTTPEERRGRTFVLLFDDMNITPWKANQAKAAVASFLEKGTREGDRVTLISTAGGTWWTARMESGRPKLLDMVKRFDGRYIPDTATDRISDWEALRIHVYRDPQVMERVMRRFETYGVGSSLNRSPGQQRALGHHG